MIVEAALQEDVDVIGISILSGAHMALVPRVLELLKANGQDNVRVFVGGIIPAGDSRLAGNGRHAQSMARGHPPARSSKTFQAVTPQSH
jgi:methylmalonyl-CoA mutase cobalamin-binding domain/chain